MVHFKASHYYYYCLLGLQQDLITEGFQRTNIILQNSKQLFGEVHHDDSEALPLLFDGRKFLLKEHQIVSPVSNTMTSSQNEESIAMKTVSFLISSSLQLTALS